MNEIAPIDNYDRAKNCILLPQNDQIVSNIGTAHINNDFLIYQDPNGECTSISITQEQLAELGIPLHSYQNVDVGYQIAANNVRKLLLDDSKKIADSSVNNNQNCANIPTNNIQIIEDNLLPSTFVINPVGTPCNPNSILSRKPVIQTGSNINQSVGDVNLPGKNFNTFTQNARFSKVNVCKKRMRMPNRNLKKVDRKISNNGNVLTNSSLNKALNEGVPIAVPAHSNILPVQIQNGSTEKLTKSAPTHTTIHLLQNGEKFHSLEKLQGEQLKFVETALNSVGNPIKNKNYVMFDPDTKTRIIYRIVYPEDLKLYNEVNGVGKTKAETDKSLNTPKSKTKENAGAPAEKSPKVVLKTRSGRAVKVPRHMEDSIEPMTPATTPYVANPRRKVHMLRCSHCLQPHRGAKKLSQHYEEFPDHKPQTQIKRHEATEQLFNCNDGHTLSHVDLFDCLIKIVDSTLAESRAATFITQVDLLIKKLKNLMPSMVGSKADDESKESKCIINKDVSKILDMPPGEYNLNFEVLKSDIPDMSSKPVENVSKEVVKTQEIISKPSQFWLSKHNEEHASNSDNENEMECSRTNSVDKWPKIKNKWSMFNNYSENSPKKIKGQSEPIEWLSNTDIHEMTSGKWFSSQKQMKIPISEADWLPQDINDIDITTSVFTSADIPDNITSCSSVLSFSDLSDSIANIPYTSDCINVHMKPITSNAQSKGTHMDETLPQRNTFEFHSSHFNIRSSPLKAEQAASFNKIQINNELLPSFIKLTEQENAPILFKQMSNSVLTNSSGNCSLQATSTTDVLTRIDVNHSNLLLSPANHIDRGNGKMTLDTLAETISGYPIKDLNMVSARDLNHMKAFTSSVLNDSSPDCSLQLANTTDGLTDISIHSSPLMSPGNHHLTSDNSKLSLDTLADSIGAYPIKSMNNSLDLDMVSTSDLSHIKPGHGQNHNQSTNTRIVDCLSNHLETQLERKDSLLASVNETQLNASGMLTDGISETQLRRSEVLLSVNETSLDCSRLGLSSGQSDLQLLDTLGNDCLSFSDSELRTTSQMSLDLPLDLFPFHHS